MKNNPFMSQQLFNIGDIVHTLEQPNYLYLVIDAEIKNNRASYEIISYDANVIFTHIENDDVQDNGLILFKPVLTHQQITHIFEDYNIKKYGHQYNLYNEHGNVMFESDDEIQTKAFFNYLRENAIEQRIELLNNANQPH